MGLNEEVAAASAKNTINITGEGAAEETPLMGEVDKNLGLPAPEGEAEAAAEAASAEAKIIIGDQSFDSKEEAWAYAKDLQRKVDTESLADDMYRQGIRDATMKENKGENVTEPAPPEENFEEEFYSDPQAYMKKMQGQMLEEAEKLAERKFEARDAEARGAQETKALWDSFYGENEDLRAKEVLVQAILNKDWDGYKNLQPKAAMTRLATAVRTELRNYGLEAQPAVELNGGRGGVSSGGGENVTTKAPAEKPLDFISQINNIQSKGINS